MKSNQFIFVSILIITTAFSNIILADIPNFSPIASVALFSGFYFSNKKYKQTRFLYKQTTLFLNEGKNSCALARMIFSEELDRAQS